jgi:hypothetical protein
VTHWDRVRCLGHVALHPAVFFYLTLEIALHELRWRAAALTRGVVAPFQEGHSLMGNAWAADTDSKQFSSKDRAAN